MQSDPLGLIGSRLFRQCAEEESRLILWVRFLMDDDLQWSVVGEETTGEEPQMNHEGNVN